jgi:hypothetical protein
MIESHALGGDQMKVLTMSFRSILLLLCLNFLNPLAAWCSDAIPKVLWSRHDPSKAAWVSLDRALLANGQIDWNLFGELQSATLRRGIEAHKGSGCVSIGPLQKVPMDSKVAQDLPSLARNSQAVLKGTVIASGLGFADGDPATLLKVRVDETLKSNPEFANEGYIYIAYPIAELTAGGVHICKSDDRLTSVPGIGDRLLVLPLSGPLDGDGELIYPYSQEIVVQKQGGGVTIPQRWTRNQPALKASSLPQVEAIIRANQGPDKPREKGL